MNIYDYKFTSVCPNDGETITYDLNVRSKKVIYAEDIVNACKKHSKNFHESIADDLIIKLGGRQTITAVHCDVKITTKRGFD